MPQPFHTESPWDAEGVTTIYSAPTEADAITMIEIRAHVTDSGWDTVAFIDAASPFAKRNARLIASSPKLLDALFEIKRRAQKSGDHEADPFTLLDLILDEAMSAITHAIEE